MAFLLADPSAGSVECPLPIHATPQNRPRWDPTYSIGYHIFRDRYERKPRPPPQRRVNHNVLNWPEMIDEWSIMHMMYRQSHLGEPIDKEAWNAAHEGIKLITPTSPLWQPSPTP